MKKRLYLTLFLTIILSLTLTSTGCSLGIPSTSQKEGAPPVGLEWWRVWDQPSDFSGLLSAYKARRPHISIKIRNFTYEEYEEAIRDAYAEDRAPDIISLHNTWLKKYEDKKFIVPMPASITMPEVIVTGPSFYSRTKIEYKKRPTLSMRALRENFVDLIKKDVLFNKDQIYGLPLSLDTMVMYYNKDILNNEGFARPPQNWNEFLDQVRKIVKEDRFGNIILAGAAIGRGDNVLRSSDIISLLMMQNGTVMTDSGGRAIFNRKAGGDSLSPAQDALRFYTEFASPVKEAYTWNKSMPDSLEAFTTAKAAFFFGYPYHLETIKKKGQNLNFGLTPMPQTGSGEEVNFASYWIETVSKKSEHPEEAWDFLLFASSEAGAKPYLDKTKRTTALRSLIAEQQEDLEIGPIADQVLTAQSWYRGRNANVAETFMQEMIDKVVEGKMSISQAINEAVQKINQTI